MAQGKSAELEFFAIIDREIDSQRDPTTGGSLALEARESLIRSLHEVGNSHNIMTLPDIEA